MSRTASITEDIIFGSHGDNDLIKVVVANNITGLTGGVSVILRQVNI